MPAGPFHGLERLACISTLQLSRPVGINTIETTAGGLPPRSSPALGSGKASPWCLRLVAFS